MDQSLVNLEHFPMLGFGTDPVLDAQSSSPKVGKGRKAKNPQKCVTPPNKKPKRRKRTKSETNPASVPPVILPLATSASMSPDQRLSKENIYDNPTEGLLTGDQTPPTSAKKRRKRNEANQQNKANPQHNIVNWGWSPQRGKFKPQSVVSFCADERARVARCLMKDSDPSLVIRSKWQSVSFPKALTIAIKAGYIIVPSF